MRSTAETKEVLLKLFPVRRSGAQKADFREWLAREMKGAGYRCKEERYGKTNGSVNVVAGDPDRATVFLVAHYDTPSRMLVPNFVSPTNVPAHFLYHFVTAFLLLALALVVSFAVTFPINQPKATFPLFVLLALGVLFWTGATPTATPPALRRCWPLPPGCRGTSGSALCSWTTASGTSLAPAPFGNSTWPRGTTVSSSILTA